ncbi:MAG: hypothetical protein V7K40_15760 [Nostoc sp.]
MLFPIPHSLATNYSFASNGNVFNARERINIASARINNAADALTLYRDTLALYRDALTMQPTHWHCIRLH